MRERSGSDSTALRHSVTRRTFLQVGTASLLERYLASETQAQMPAKPASVFLQQEASRKKMIPVVYVHLEGGASPWDTFTPFSSASTNEYRGRYSPIQTSVPGLHYSELFPKLASIADQTTLLRAVDSESHDHFISTASLLVQDKKVLGRRVGDHVPNTIVPYTFLNTTGQYQNDGATLKDHHPEDSFRVDWDPTQQRFPEPAIKADPALHTRRGLLRSLDTITIQSDSLRRADEMRQRAFSLLMGEGGYFHSFAITEDVAAQFGQVAGDPPNQFAHAAALADRLVGNGAAFVTIHDCEVHGWDMHSGQHIKDELPILSDHLDRGLYELAKRARANGYLVMCSSEFGRTPVVNSSGGRDHDNVHFAIGAGGRLREGAVTGEINKVGKITKERLTNAELGDLIIAAAGGQPKRDVAQFSGLLKK